MSAASISARPSEQSGRKIAQLAAELNLSPGQFVIQAAEAIIGMVEAATDDALEIPKIVDVARALRQSGVTYATPARRFGRPRAPADTMVLSVMPAQPKSDSLEVAGKTNKRARKRSVPASTDNNGQA